MSASATPSETEAPQPQEGPLCIGDKVEVQLKKKTSIGELKFIGRIKGKPKIVYGVELRRDGKNSGGLEGQDYFPCAQQRGVFVGRNKILRFKPGDGLEDAPRITIGDKVATEAEGTGYVRYLGYPQFCDGMRYGVELDKPKGRYNGSVEGVYYFNARNLFGTFMELGQLRKVEEEEAPAEQNEAATESKEADEQKDANADEAAEENDADNADAGDADAEEKVDAQDDADEQASSPVEEKEFVEPAESSDRFIPALRSDSLLQFMIRQPNGPFSASLFDVYCGDGGSLLKASFDDIRSCSPGDQLKILCMFLQRFVTDLPDFASSLECAPFGCGPNGYETQTALVDGLEGAYQDLLAVRDDEVLRPTIPPAFLRNLPVASLPSSMQNQTIDMDSFLGSAETGDFILFGGGSGFNRLISHFSNSPFSHAALIVKGAIKTDENTYNADDSIALVHACVEPCAQMMDGIVDESLSYCVVAADPESLLQRAKAAGEFAVFHKLEADDPDMLSDIQHKIADWSTVNVGSSFEAAQDGLPLTIREFLTAMYTAKDAQANRFTSAALLASALQEGDVMSNSRTPQSFVAGCFSSCCGNRVGYRNGPYPHASTMLYDGVTIGHGSMIDFSTLPA